MTEFWSVVRLSVLDPQAAGAALKDWKLDRDAGWSLLALGICLSVILMFALTGMPAIPLLPGIQPLGPIAFAVMVMSMSVFLVFALYFSADALGGSGRFADSVLLVAWFQIMQLLAQAVQTVTTLVLPPLGVLLSFAIIGWLLWLLLSLIKEINGLKTYGRATLALLLGVTGVVLGLSLILGLLGVGVTPPQAAL